MTATIHEVEQGTDEWRRIRAGLPTASEFHTVLAKGKSGGESITRRKYLYTLAGEIVTGEPGESYENAFMARGKEMEDEARDRYAFVYEPDLRRVGFITNGPKGCSPDSLIGGDGMLEIKTKKADIAIDVILRDQFPTDHVAQCQGGLWVAEREWIDLCVYWPGLPLFVKRAHRDEAYIRDLAAAVDKFNDELAEIVDRVRRYGAPTPSTLAADLSGSLLMAG